MKTLENIPQSIKELLYDSKVTGIKIIGCNIVGIKKKNRKQYTTNICIPEKEYLALLKELQEKYSNINKYPIYTFTDKNFSKDFYLKFAISTPLVTTDNYYITLRKLFINSEDALPDGYFVVNK